MATGHYNDLMLQKENSEKVEAEYTKTKNIQHRNKSQKSELI